MSFTAVLYGLLGFLAGYLAGSVWGFGKRNRAARPKTEPAGRRWSKDRWIGPVVLLLAILMGVQYLVQVNREREASACQTEFNLAFSRQLSIRSELSSQAQANVDSIILSIGKLVSPANSEPTPAEQARAAAEYRKLFTDFAKESAAISKKRAETPLPKLPDCGDGGDTALPSPLASELARIEALEANIDANRRAILASQIDFNDSDPAEQTPSARVIAVQLPAPAPAVKPSVVVVKVPTSSPVTPPPVLQPPVVPTAAPVAPPECILNLLGLCL